MCPGAVRPRRSALGRGGRRGRALPGRREHPPAARVGRVAAAGTGASDSPSGAAPGGGRRRQLCRVPGHAACLSRGRARRAARATGAHRAGRPPNSEDKQALAKQQAQAAVALLHLGRTERVWPLFHQGADPTCRTYLIHRCAALGVDPAILASRLLGDEEKDPSIRQGLLLALGEYGADQRAEVVRGPLVDRVAKDYREDTDPGRSFGGGMADAPMEDGGSACRGPRPSRPAAGWRRLRSRAGRSTVRGRPSR